MDVATTSPAGATIRRAALGPAMRMLLTMVGTAGVLAAIAAVWLWGQQPPYRVLFANVSDRDGGAIVAALQQMNVPYRFTEGGGAILVPEEKVHDARLRLAAQGLPRGGNVGFELMENQRVGVSQFLEQVNFQRALEGELARSIQSLSAIQAARVHLAMPKASVFVREQQKASASVLVNLHPGRTLEQQQVNAITHLVSSSVPGLPVAGVTVVDQNGNLLSEGPTPGHNGLDANQLRYVQRVENAIEQRIESILAPIVGRANVRATASADIDFSHVEQAAETHGPNQGNNPAAVRSQQSSDATNSGGQAASGIPGALTNQPPAPATAPITAPPGTNPVPATGATATAQASSQRRDSTVNYEVDRTIRYVQQPIGGIRRLAVAVVLNHRQVTDEAGKVSSVALTDDEKAKVTELVREAMGFNKERGDSLSVINAPFATLPREVVPPVPLWKQPQSIELARQAGWYLVLGLLLLYLLFGVLRPMVRRLNEQLALERAAAAAGAAAIAGGSATVVDGEGRPGAPLALPNRLDTARQIAKSEPKMVANVVKGWVNGSN